jgi:hypothetical protein
MIALGPIAVEVIESILPYFNLSVTSDRLMQDVIEPDPKTPPQPA